MNFRKAVLFGLLTVSLIFPKYVYAADSINTLGTTPVLATSSVSVYKQANLKSEIVDTVCSNTAVRIYDEVDDFYKIHYKQDFAYVPKEFFLKGEELEDYVFNQPLCFGSIIVVKDEVATLIDPRTGKRCFDVKNGEMFAIQDDTDKDFYSVLYRDRKYLLYKGATVRKYSVPVMSFYEFDMEQPLRNQLVDYSGNFVGNPYVWGGTDLITGADCSGFVQSLFSKFNICLPRTSWEQASSGVNVDPLKAQPGDLLFFGSAGAISHVGMYVGNNKMIEAKGVAYGIVISDVDLSKVIVCRDVINNEN